MDDIWFAPGVSPGDVETYLAALSIRGDAPPPLLAVAREENGALHLVLASRALFALFDAAGDRALADRLLSGPDPGARRLATLCQTLPLQGAPRLERLRFSIGPTSEIITFLCRRVLGEANQPIFVAAALGVRAGLMSEPARPLAFSASPLTQPSRPAPQPALTIQALQTALRTRWPTNRTVRFLWQTDAEGLVTVLSPQLAEVVGAANADLLGRNFAELAPTLDPSGRLAQALASQTTWSGIDVSWPVAEACAAIPVGLGAIPAQDREIGFDGYRGYGVLHLDRLVAHEPRRLWAPALGPVAPATGRPTAPDNVVAFPGGRTLSAEDQAAFDTLRAELRDKAGLDEAELPPLVEPPPPSTAQESAPQMDPLARRRDEIGRNALPLLDRIASGILVSRDNIPIFANRHLLDLLGFADEDALHEAGGLAQLFGVPANASGSEAVAVRTASGDTLPVQARMQRIEWDGLPATMLTLQPHVEPPAPEPPAPPEPSARAEPIATQEPTSVAEPTTDEALGREVRELRAILETATDGVAVMDADCTIISLNRSGEALFGCDRGTVIGQPFLNLFAPENQGLANDYIEGLKSNATRSLLNDGREILIRTQRGDTIAVFMTLGRIDARESDAADAGRFCALFRDLTHSKKIERELDAARRDAERTSALKSDFLAKVSHEIRTPLNAIIGFAEVILDERFGPIGNERYKDYMRDIHGSGTHVMSLVNDLLDLSKIEAGKMELAEDALDVNRVVNECVSIMQPQAARARVILRLSLAPQLPQIRADARSLRQIVLNLLSNAVKFNDPGGQVIVASATTDGGQVVIRIRDTGHGMSEEDVAAALEPFRQLSGERPAGAGTGLGLPLTKALVEANEATFSIKSKRNQGTLVEVAFPPARVLAN